MRSPNFYAGLELERWSERRRDESWLAARLAARETRIVPVWRTKNLVREGATPTAVFLEVGQCTGVLHDPIFLGEGGGTSYFAIDLSPLDEPALAAVVNGQGNFVDLRAVGALIDRQHGALLAYARGIVHWHARSRFCSVCGAPTQSAIGGHVRKCTNAACGADHFPRTDPAVIMLVTDGDRCLLARQKQWPQRMFSTLAGFVEPGESLEDAVAREVREEAGIEVTDIRYHSSQPWPFPSSLMLGFIARAATTELRLDRDELEDGGWFTREFLRQPHAPEVFRLPRHDSIARRLIQDWLDDA